MSGAQKQSYSPSPQQSTTFKPSDSRGTPAAQTADTTLFPLNQDQETQIITAVRAFQAYQTQNWSLKTEMENIDREYMREKDWTEDQIKSRIANRRGDARKIQNVTVPIVQPQVNSALTYLSNVFVTGYPIFPVVGDPSVEDAAMQLETIVQENAETAGWSSELIKFFRDGLKYNIHALEVEWQQKVNWDVGNDVSKQNGAGAKKVLWEGNVIKRMDLYNTFWDTRVAPSKVHIDGEFAGYTELYTKVRFKAFCNSLYNKAAPSVVKRALESAPLQGAVGTSVNTPFGYYIPYINPLPFYNKTATMDWMAWATNVGSNKSQIQYKNSYSVTKVYVRLLPSDFDLNVPEKNTPQVWKFVIINGAVILTAERLTNIHSFLPIIFGQPIDDGLDYQTKSFASNVTDMQDVSSALWNGHLASKRRLVGDRVLYDPSRIKESDINSTNPAAKIPVRPSAYGKPLQESVYQFPFRDEQTDSLIQSSNLVVAMANLINGQNPAQQGQFVKGNKTRHEYEDIMGHGNGQNQMLAISIENQVFIPVKQIIKLNILQYQTTKQIFNKGKGVPVTVDPVNIRQQAVHFKVCDGLVPTDKVLSEDMFQTAIQQLASSEQLGSQFNLGDAVVYLMKTQGADLTPFKKTPEQLQYEQALAAWQQAAMAAAKTGATFSTPMPQPSESLQEEQQEQQQGKLPPAQTASALESTQG